MFRAGAAVVCAVLLAGCAAKAKAADDQPPPTPTTAARTTTTTIDLSAPARVGDLAVSEVATPMPFAPRAQWLRIQHSGGAAQLAAVFRPAKRGRYPVVVYLHGSSGLGLGSLRWSQRLADAGFVVVAGCYLDPYPSARVLGCPGLLREEPDIPAQSAREYKALVDVASALPDALPDSLSVVGISWGAIIALSLPEPRVRAVVADSGYGRNGADVVTAPVFLLGMDIDSHVLHERVVMFEAALRFAHKRVTTQYYPGAGHVATLEVPPVNDDATHRVIAFLQSQS